MGGDVCDGLPVRAFDDGADDDADEDEGEDAEDLEDDHELLRRGVLEVFSTRCSVTDGLGCSSPIPATCCGGSGTIVAVPRGGSLFGKCEVKTAEGTEGCVEHAPESTKSGLPCEVNDALSLRWVCSHRRSASAMMVSAASPLACASVSSRCSSSKGKVTGMQRIIFSSTQAGMARSPRSHLTMACAVHPPSSAASCSRVRPRDLRRDSSCCGFMGNIVHPI